MKTISTFDLPHVDLNGWQATILDLNFPPGLASPKHTHPGFVLG
jgi:quercetin dioxygenase-like cupin family protein